MHQEGDGNQKLDLFKRPVEKVLCELEISINNININK